MDSFGCINKQSLFSYRSIFEVIHLTGRISLVLKLTNPQPKIEWDEWVKERLDYFDGNIEEAEKDCMTEWFLNMDMCVKGIYWDVDEKGYKAIFSIAETYNILE